MNNRLYLAIARANEFTENKFNRLDVPNLIRALRLKNHHPSFRAAADELQAAFRDQHPNAFIEPAYPHGRY